MNVIVTNSDTQSGTLTQGFTYTAVIQSGTDGERNFARVGNGRGWYGSDHYGHGIPGGSDGEPGRNTSHGCDGGEQHVDYSHHSGACSGCGGRSRVKRRTTCRHAAQWLYLYFDRPGLGLGVPSGGFKFGHCSCRTNRSYTLSIGGAGLSGTASLSCTGSPTGANCSVPASEPFSSTVPATFNVSVTTTSRTVGALRLPAFAPVAGLWIFALLGMVVHPGRRIPTRSLRRYSPAHAVDAIAPLMFLRRWQ